MKTRPKSPAPVLLVLSANNHHLLKVNFIHVSLLADDRFYRLTTPWKLTQGSS